MKVRLLPLSSELHVERVILEEAERQRSFLGSLVSKVHFCETGQNCFGALQSYYEKFGLKVDYCK